jgi:arylsulfatase A-like enzyme
MSKTDESQGTPGQKEFGKAPNVVIVLIDDMGFGASSAFGGPCEMPVAERLAKAGLRYNQFHTTGICSPSRAALLTGRNHHSVGVGQVMSGSSDAPGYHGRIPKSAGTLARVLRENGYATGAFGKMHEQPRRETTPVGPFDRWPTQLLGFEKFYGFLNGSMNHWVPTLYDGTTPIEPPGAGKPGYHLSEDLIDQATAWIDNVRAITPGRPFFCYLPFGATHAPFHVPPEWIEKYRGRFEHGWNAQRDRTLARQKAMGIVPPGTDMGPWPHSVESWSDLSADEQKAAAGLMEVYAGFAEHTDAQVGRMVDYLSTSGMLDNTIFLYILGDNGASAEGGRIGTAAGYYTSLDGATETVEMILSDLPQAGSVQSCPHYARGWAVAMDTPLQWFKQVASHYGGTRNGLIAHWPDRLAGHAGEIRSQWHHLIDLAPTILKAAGIEPPALIDGIPQDPLHGVDMTYSFDAPQAPSTHITQYFEIGGNRAIYHEGWVACTVHRPTPWNFLQSTEQAWEDDVWELYDTRSDFSEAHDLAQRYPQKLEELKRLFQVEAEKNNVLPLDGRSLGQRRRVREAKNAAQSVVLKGNASRIPQDALPPLFNHSHTVTALIEVGEGAAGVICSHGGLFSGWSLYCLDGVLNYCHALGIHERYYVRATERLAPGRHEVVMQFDYRGPGLGGEAGVQLHVDGLLAAGGTLRRSIGYTTPAGEEVTVGSDPGTPVTDEYAMLENDFSGTVHWVRIASGEGSNPDAADIDRVESALQ